MSGEQVINNQATLSNTNVTEEESTNNGGVGTESSSTTTTTPAVVPKRKLTEEEKREILRRRRLEKIKGNSESRMNKLLYGDSAPAVTTQSESLEVTKSTTAGSHDDIDDVQQGCTTTPKPTLDSNPVIEKPSTLPEEHSPHPSPIEALNFLINQKVEEAYSPLFKLHDPKLIEKETREYNEPMSVENNTSTMEEEQQTTAIPNLANWDKETTVKAKPSFFEKLRPLFVLILALICAVSTIYDNEKLHFGAVGLDTLLGYFGKFTPVTVLITFELALFLPRLLSGNSIFSMHTESALDMFLFAKGIWVSVDRFMSDIVLFLFVFIVTSILSNNLHATTSVNLHQKTSIEDLQQQIEQLLKQ